jgi:hypothetical protein
MRVAPLKEEERSVKKAMSDPREYNRSPQEYNVETAYSKDRVGGQMFRNGINRRYTRFNKGDTRPDKESNIPLLTAKD